MVSITVNDRFKTKLKPQTLSNFARGYKKIKKLP